MICLFYSQNSEQIISETWSQNNRSSERNAKKQIDGTNKKETPRQENMTACSTVLYVLAAYKVSSSPKTCLFYLQAKNQLKT